MEFIMGALGFIWGLVPMLVVLGFLIFVHELGHFLAARRVGVRVEVFSLGFGPRLFGFTRGDTDYRISAIPFGGYVKMAGGDMAAEAESPDSETNSAEDEDGFSRLPAEKPREYQDDELPAKSIPARGLVYISGAGMNAIVAVIITTFLAYTGIYVSENSQKVPEIGWVVTDSPAADAGFETGDIILKVDRKTVGNWDDAYMALFLNPDISKPVTVMRNEQELTRTLDPVDLKAFPRGGFAMPTRIIVGSIRPDSPADEGGLKVDDILVGVNGRELKTVEELQVITNDSKGALLNFDIRRNEELFSTQITAEHNADLDRYLIGIGFSSDQVLKKYPFVEAVQMGFVMNYKMGKSMLELLGQLVTGKASPKNLGGPVMIGVLAKKASDAGIRPLLALTSFISLNLAILNVLPIPILDGGLILFLLIELVRRKPVSEKFLIVVQNIFFFILISFALFITYMDILRIPTFFQ